MSKGTVELKTKAELSAMRRAGAIAGRTLQEVRRHLKPGATTRQLDAIAEKFIRSQGATPSFLGYRGYEASICVSVNEEVVHGIPGARVLKPGDLVSVDVGATFDGFVGDTAMSVVLEPADPKVLRLVRTTEQALDEAIAVMRPGNRLGDIGWAVQRVAEAAGYGVVRDFVGHGIGRRMHEDPAVPNYGKAGTGLRLEPGMVLAVEPMVTLGDWDVEVLSDGWTVVTKDGEAAAHVEHTIAITEGDPVIFTKVS